MKRSEYASITRNPQGAKIREILASAISRQPPPIPELRAWVKDANLDPDEGIGAAILKQCRELAGKMAAGGAAFALRQQADLSAVGYMRELAAGDDLLGRSLLHGESQELETEATYRQIADRLSAGDLDAEAQAQRLADEAERDRLRALGFRPLEG